MLSRRVVILLAGNGTCFDKAFGTLEIGLCLRRLRLSLAQLGLRLIEHDLERSRIDTEQGLPLSHHAAFRHTHRNDLATDPGAQFHAFGRGQCAIELC